jgi:3,4-dihydroxy 2-butanone 4-phosphate synthase/GTP cyclohydrolase II
MKGESVLSQASSAATSTTLGARHEPGARESILAAMAEGQPIVVASPDGCDLIVLAARASTASTAFLIRHGTGFITVAMPADRLAALRIPSQGDFDRSPHAPALHAAVDAATDITTGISAHDRARTIRLLSDPSSTPATFTRPGHVIPIRADFESNAPPGVAETVAMFGLVAAGTPVAAICSLVSDSDPTSIAQADEGQQIARGQGIAFVHSWEITQMFYHHCALRDLRAT